MHPAALDVAIIFICGERTTQRNGEKSMQKGECIPLEIAR